MEFFRRNPVFYTLLLGLLICCLVGLWYLAQLNGELRGLRESYQTKSSQYDRYLAARPSPTSSNLAVLEENYRELYENFEAAMRVLNLNTYNRDSFFGSVPASRADWSFALHRYKENARYSALSNSIELPSNVAFGVADFQDGAPPADQAESLHEQITIMSAILDTLFESGIDSFVKIQRGEKSKGAPQRAVARRTDERLYSDGVEFLVSPGQSVAIPGTIDSHLFRVAFRGQTLAMRNFLNNIAASGLPFVVRGVEVDLSSEGGAKIGLESIAENPFSEEGERFANEVSSVPIISDNTSLFLVTLEFLDLSVEIPEPAAVETKGGGDA